MVTPSSKVTIHDIARALGVSASTVSRALAGNPAISSTTRARVEEKASELGYRPNAVATALRMGRSGIIGVIIPQANRFFFAEIINGAEAEAHRQGWRVVVMQHHNDGKRESEHIETLLRMQVDGMIVTLSSEDTAERAVFQRLIDERFPVAFVDRCLPDMAIPRVVIDDFSAGELATNHLIEQGYRRIAHLGRTKDALLYRERERGYRAAFATAGMPVDEALVLKVDSDIEAGAEAYRSLSALPGGVDAIFSTSDYAALGFARAALADGKDIPGDLGVVGFANEPFTQYTTPTLSSVDQHSARLGELAAAHVLDQLQNPPARKRRLEPGGGTQSDVIVAPTLLIRESSRRRPADNEVAYVLRATHEHPLPV